MVLAGYVYVERVKEIADKENNQRIVCGCSVNALLLCEADLLVNEHILPYDHIYTAGNEVEKECDKVSVDYLNVVACCKGVLVLRHNAHSVNAVDSAGNKIEQNDCKPVKFFHVFSPFWVDYTLIITQ